MVSPLKNSAAPFSFALPNWKVPAGRLLEVALNRALALDADTRAALPALDGRTVALQLQNPSLALQIRVRDNQLEVGPVEDADRADLSVRSTLAGVLGQLPFMRGRNAAPLGAMRVEGDAELARRLQRMAERFDPDWVQPFTRVFGDVMGVQIANALAAALRGSREFARGFARDSADFLTEESRDVVGKEELRAFYSDVDHLRDDAERLQARFDRVQVGPKS